MLLGITNSLEVAGVESVGYMINRGQVISKRGCLKELTLELAEVFERSEIFEVAMNTPLLQQFLLILGQLVGIRTEEWLLMAEGYG